MDTTTRSRAAGPAEARAAIERFLAAARQPALLEAGEDVFPLTLGSFELDWRNGRLAIQVWDETRTLARRIIGLAEEKSGKLELKVERFGKQEGRVSLVDLDRARPDTERRGARLVFREQFRRFLGRQFAGWTLAELSTEANLEETLSPAYPRALLKKGAAGWAAVAASTEPGAAAGALTFGLIWLEYLRRRERRLTIEGLALFLPQREARAACLRLPWLDEHAARWEAFVYSEDGYEERLDPRDYGNLDTKLEPCAGPFSCAPPVTGWIERLSRLPHVGQRRRGDGSLSLHVHGMEFAHAGRSGLAFGLERRTPVREANLGEAEQLARELGRLRSAAAADHTHPLYRLQPEAWLEAQVRSQLESIDASLTPDPVYTQVPAVAGCDRGIMDLVAADRDGRLAVLELKASEDVHLPLQALDYWMRVRWHLERGEFSSRGYFPGIELRRDWPRLLLVAPALQFHPQTETLLRYFSPAIEVERIGLGVEWRKEPKVMFRMRGAARPL